MTYAYKCDTCGKITDIEKSILEDIPKEVKCSHCGKKAPRYWKASITIPDHFKATSETSGGDSYANLDNLRSTFKHARRPSGREKTYW